MKLEMLKFFNSFPQAAVFGLENKILEIKVGNLIKIHSEVVHLQLYI